MKIDKKKTVFASIVTIVLLFIFGYSYLVFEGSGHDEVLKDPKIPELEEEPQDYTTRTEALGDLKEERKTEVPSIYSEALQDSMGYEDHDSLEKKQSEMAESLYTYEVIKYDSGLVKKPPKQTELQSQVGDENILISEMAISHAEFFKAGGVLPQENDPVNYGVKAQVNGKQTVKNKDRLELILLEDLVIGHYHFKKHSLVYGEINLRPNRVHIRIDRINELPVGLEAYDLQDNAKGIYLKNSVREEAGSQLLEDLVQDVNVSGIPQLGGLKNVFRRNNRSKKVTILDQYKLILKPSL